MVGVSWFAQLFLMAASRIFLATMQVWFEMPCYGAALPSGVIGVGVTFRGFICWFGDAFATPPLFRCYVSPPCFFRSLALLGLRSNGNHSIGFFDGW